MIRTHARIEGGLDLEADVVIVGSGAGGAPMAHELARGGLDVVLLEEGGRYRTEDFTRRPLEMLSLLYRDGGQTTALGRPSIPVPLGRTLGGTTTVNSGTCFRTPDRVLDRWDRELGIPVSGEMLDPSYRSVEEAIHVSVPDEELIGNNGLIMKRGAEELGLSGGIIPRNIDGCQGSGVCCFGCPTGAKQATGLSYLPRASEEGARIYANVRVEGIETEGCRATGVRGAVLRPPDDEPTHPVTVRARAVVVACGTLLTPVILEASGLGSVSRSLGRNLHLHPASKIVAEMPEPVRCWDGIPQSYYIDALAEEHGVMIEGAALPPALGALGLPLVGRAHRRAMERFDHMAIAGLLVSDRTTGRVRRNPVDGRFLATYDLGRGDAARMVRGLNVLARLLFAAGAERLYTPIHRHPVIREPAEVDRVFRPGRVRPGELELSAFHPMGTARMGADPSRSVVDPRQRVHGVENLWIADGSVLPTSLDVNPMLTIMALSVRAARMMLDDWPV